MNDDETIDPSRLSQDGRKIRPGDTTSPYLDFGRGPDTSVDSDMTGPVRNYLPGDIIDGAYQLTAVLGRGGMGVVFACRHQALGQDYAVKILSGESLSDQHWMRFQVEAKALAKLNHPGIVSIYNMGIDEGTCPYYVMDLLSGEGLDSLIARSGPLPVDRALDYFLQVADALTCAHAQGIIHRDIKPSNLMLMNDHTTQDRNRTGRVKIVDFGIARLSKQGLGTQSQTATGLIFGTPFYMSPEQCQGLKVDERSDIYSFGCALFEALTGSPPFIGENAFQTFLMHQTETPPRLADRAPEGHFSQSLESAMAKMLRKAPSDRYQRMDQVMHDLERIRAGKEIMTQGLSSTISPHQIVDNLAGAERRKENEIGAHGSWPFALKVALLLVVPLVLLGGALFAFQNLHSPAKAVVQTEDPGDNDLILLTRVGDLKKAGCTPEEIKVLRQYDFMEAHADREDAKKTFEKYLASALSNQSHILNKDRTVFNFPQNIIIGAISFGEGKPVKAYGPIKVPADESVCFYQSCYLRGLPSFIDLFGPEDLNGLALIQDRPGEAISRIKNWKRLRQLSFFNPLTKPMPGFEEFEQSRISNSDLPAIEQLQNLDSLGLCGSRISGAKVADMRLIRRLTSLRLNKIKDIDSLLKVLPDLDNLKEVWLIAQNTTDEQLQYLIRMKNLESLKIRRSQLTPKSLDFFCRMRTLRRLYLDSNFTAAEKSDLNRSYHYVNLNLS